MIEPTKIYTCGLTIEQQRLYIRQLKKMLTYSDINICCPARKKIVKLSGDYLEEFLDPDFLPPHNYLDLKVCQFCRINVGLITGCPCRVLGKNEALRRAKNFIKRFEGS